jgi:meso-butanediol dehydrogenase/(S,S)-butanediol dehydrogenase/diacetyl reductase
VLIIGGTQGIGRGTALRLAKEGASVMIAACGRERLDAVAAEVL